MVGGTNLNLLDCMPHITAFEVFAIDLPFRMQFKHAAASRRNSESVFIALHLDDGTIGWGEALPRSYVTGETRDGACRMLKEIILPRLIDRSFTGFEEVHDFLTDCDGRAPAEWVDPKVPQSAAWCAVDLALLDAFGKHFQKPVGAGLMMPKQLRYSGVLSAGSGWKQWLQLAAYRGMGFRALKLKIDADTTVDDIAAIRRQVGEKVDLRVDVNGAWDGAQALELMPQMARYGIRSFEQPLAAEDVAGSARLIRETGLDVMADESLNTADSLKRLIDAKACTAVNVRISKCGGLIASQARCREALAAGLWVQIGCQVGESSLLSAAHLVLCASLAEVRYAEGCFGKLLLKEDPALPCLQMGRGGAPPRLPQAPGFGVSINRAALSLTI